MDVSISTRHGEIPVATQQRIEEKVRKLPRYFVRVSSISVTVDLQNQEPKVEIHVSAEERPEVVASGTGTNVISACDAAVQRIERQLKKHKEKITGHRATGHKHIETFEKE